MAYILNELEDMFVEFIRQRVPEQEWQYITTSQSILTRLDEDAENEMRSTIWNELLSNLSWSRIVQDIRILRENTLIPDSDSTSIRSEEEEEEPEDDTRSEKSYFD